VINIKPEILKGSWVKLEPLNESHKNELYSAAQDESIWTYNSSKAYGEQFYRWFDKQLNAFKASSIFPLLFGVYQTLKLLVAPVIMILALSIIN